MTDTVSVEDLRKQFESFESATNNARKSSEEVRDHRDLKQWTAEQLAELAKRKQAPIVIPKIAAKVDFLMGLERQRRADPKALPRNPEQDQKSADVASAALRFVADCTRFDKVASKVFEHACLVEGVAAAIVEPVKRRDKIEIEIRFIPFDRYYFDPQSRDEHFEDKTFDGYVQWLDVDDAKRRYPDAADKISEAMTAKDGSNAGSHGDQPKWYDSQRKQIKVCVHYFLRNGEWHVAHFAGEHFLLEPQVCPLVNEYGEPENPLEALSGYVDREGNRYGFAKSLIGLEKEIVQRRSKSLHLLSSERILYEQGALPNARKVANELKKADGAIELPPGSLSEGRVQIHTNGEMAIGHVNLLQEANAEFESRGASSIALDADSGMSGRALRTIDTNRKLEIGPLIDNHRLWKERIYRQIWHRARQFWDELKWIRVTDDENALKWLGLNEPVTVGQQLQEQAEAGDERAAMALQEMTATGDPRLNQVHKVRNNVAELDVDIIVDEAPDAATVQQEQFEIICELLDRYGPDRVPFELVLELSSLQNKDRIIEKLQGDPQQTQQAAELQAMQQQLEQLAQRLALESQQAKNDNTRADTAKKAADAEKIATETEQNKLENAVISAFPDTQPNINI